MRVNENFEEFKKEKGLTIEQEALLEKIKDKIINNSFVAVEDLKSEPELLMNLYNSFGDKYKEVIEELNVRLVA